MFDTAMSAMATLGVLLAGAVAAGLLVVFSGFVMVGGLRLLATGGSRAGRRTDGPPRVERSNERSDTPADAWCCRACGAVNDVDFDVCKACTRRLPSHDRERATHESDSGFES
jgi:hypothetical protein